MTIADPRGVSGTPFYTGVADVMTFEASAAVTNKQLVVILATDDETLKVAPADTDTHDPASKVAVALEDIASGGFGQVVVRGPAVVNTPAAGPSVGERLIMTSTAGVGDGVAADATTVEGDTHGVFLSDEIGTSDTAWVWLD